MNFVKTQKRLKAVKWYYQNGNCALLSKINVALCLSFLWIFSEDCTLISESVHTPPKPARISGLKS